MKFLVKLQVAAVWLVLLAGCTWISLELGNFFAALI